MSSRVLRLGAHVLCLVLSLACLPLAAADDGGRALDILLTNDDGFRAPGIEALQAALAAAGHHVTMVAPRENQSGASWRISTGPVKYREESPGVWAVDGSPADAAAVGLRVIYAGRAPDLVVSGVNLGENVGATANVSGTIGAALMAEYLGVPAIAVSVGMDLDEKNATPPFPSTTAAFPACASFTAELVQRIAATAGPGSLLPPDTVLNVNYPVVPAGAPRGVRVAPSGRYSAFSYDYVPTGEDGEVRLAFTAEPRAATEQGSDTQLFDAGYVTISAIDGALAAEQGAQRQMTRRLEALEQP
ncbi:MAG TPA: 5'/3'-nucleotidase SurE [Gammaproteobacteria bacterium]|nr:5'/3'-nucleotidase SurE [Gammaproteobacteria bacterium]